LIPWALVNTVTCPGKGLPAKWPGPARPGTVAKWDLFARRVVWTGLVGKVTSLGGLNVCTRRVRGNPSPRIQSRALAVFNGAGFAVRACRGCQAMQRAGLVGAARFAVFATCACGQHQLPPAAHRLHLKDIAGRPIPCHGDAECDWKRWRRLLRTQNLRIKET